MKNLKNFLLVGVFSITAGCAVLQQMRPPIKPKSQFRLEQATLYSPNEGGWTLLQHKMHSAMIARNLERGSAVLSAVIYKVGMFKSSEEFLKHVADQRTKNDDNQRFKVLDVKNEFVTFKGLPCLKYETLSEDHKDKGIDSADFEYFKTTGYVCRYPLEYLAFQMEASHRSKSEEMPQALLDTSQRFFNNIGLVEPTVKRLKTIQ